jgi:methionyl-tRNA synthetase
MSKYADRLVAHIEENPSFCEPESARNEILARLRAPEGLKDLCISRTTFSWGIRVPDGFDQKHIMYVWFDALTNYLSGIGALDEGGSELGAKFWPAAKHIIGKDIKWFHCVIWPTMLMSAGLQLPQQVFAHGFVNAADGRKMSKSYNNTIDPHAMLAKYPLDTLRYYVTSSATYGTDLNFSEPALVQMHNSELADVLGNLVHRALNLSHKYCGGVVPDTTHDPEYVPTTLSAFFVRFFPLFLSLYFIIASMHACMYV